MGKTRNILLIDRGVEVLDSISACTDIFVSVLLVESEAQKERVSGLYPNIGAVFTIEEAQAANDFELNYADVEKYRATQLKVEHYLLRMISCFSTIQYVYLNALKFWLNVFKTRRIDAVVVGEIELGAPYITIPADIATSCGRLAYYFDPILNNGAGSVARAIKCATSNEYVDISRIGYDGGVDVDDFYFKSVAHATSAVTGWLPLLKRFAFSFPGYCVFTLASLFTSRVNVRLNGFQVSWFSLLMNAIYIKWLSFVYWMRSSRPELDRPFVYYAMHLEPEASILVRTPLSNQLEAVRMIAAALPEGWQVFVKEHPHQFLMANETRWYQLINVFIFRTRLFYDALLGIENVRLIRGDVSSKALIESARCVATINGTVAMEGIRLGKPVMLFGHASTPLGQCQDVFCIQSSGDVHSALRRVYSGESPKYENFAEVIKRYLFLQARDGKMSLPPEVWYRLVNGEFNSASQLTAQ